MACSVVWAPDQLCRGMPLLPTPADFAWLEADLPLVATLPRTPQPDSGLAPDIAVRLSAAALARGEDPEMAAALAWISPSPAS